MPLSRSLGRVPGSVLGEATEGGTPFVFFMPFPGLGRDQEKDNLLLRSFLAHLTHPMGASRPANAAFVVYILCNIDRFQLTYNAVILI